MPYININKRRECAKLSMQRLRAKNNATKINLIPRDYSNAVVYKICCLDIIITEFYIGSTINFSRRQIEHRSYSKEEYNYSNKLYTFIRSNGEWKNWKMEIIEKCDVKNRDELINREHYWCQTLNPLLNSKCVNSIVTECNILLLPAVELEPAVENIKLIITELYQDKFDKVLKELTNKSILPRHIYLFRSVMKDLLVSYFKKRIIKINKKTELITQSYYITRYLN